MFNVIIWVLVAVVVIAIVVVHVHVTTITDLNLPPLTHASACMYTLTDPIRSYRS